MSKARELAQFVRDLQFIDLPDEVAERAKETTLDSWGVQLATSTLPWSKIAYRYGRSLGGTPQATVLNYGFRTFAGNAAYINGCFGHGFELDYNHPGTGLKGGAIVVPTALAISEQHLKSGKEFLTAMVIGFEIMARAAIAGWTAQHDRGFDPTAASGGVGAAAIAAKLKEFNEDVTTNALLIGATVSGGGYTSTPRKPTGDSQDRGFLKRTYMGGSAFAGIRAALLAEEGMTATENMLDAGTGFCRAFDIDEESIDILTDGLGDRWELMNTHYKIYAQDGHIQPITEGLERIQKQQAFDSEDVERIVIGTHKLGYDIIVGSPDGPKTVTDAQFDARYSAALYLVKGGAGFHEYTDRNLTDPKINSLRLRAVLELDEDMMSLFDRTHARCAKVTVQLKSGEVLTEVVDQLRVMASEEVDDKFRSLSRVILDGERSEQLLETVRSLQDVRDISSLVPLLVR